MDRLRSVARAGAVAAPLTFEELCAVLAREVDPVFASATPASRLWRDLGLDELALCRMHVVVEEMNPWFSLPDQADVAFTTVGDVHHFYVSMGAQHVEGSSR